MEILVFGGTRYFGKHLVSSLLDGGHHVMIATRGRAKDPFGGRVGRIVVERTDPESIAKALRGRHFDIVCDDLAYCSNDVRFALDALDCGRYVMTSSGSVYEPGVKLSESGFDPLAKPLVWCARADFAYGEIKRLAECALFQRYAGRAGMSVSAVRFPVVLGPDDYTRRLSFYADHVVGSIPMHVTGAEKQLSFVRSDEAGRFLAFAALSDFSGPVNGCSGGTVSVAEIIRQIERRSGRHALLSEDGDEAPFNCDADFSLDTSLASRLGFSFSPLQSWLPRLLDDDIALAAGHEKEPGRVRSK